MLLAGMCLTLGKTLKKILEKLMEEPRAPEEEEEEEEAVPAPWGCSHLPGSFPERWRPLPNLSFICSGLKEEL